MNNVLVVNCGSSSIKYQIIDMDEREVLGKGLVERIGESVGHATHTDPEGNKHEVERPIPDHTAGFDVMIEQCAAHGPVLEELGLKAVGHRVVLGGEAYDKATIIDEEMLRIVDEMSPLAPLHNPANVTGVRAGLKVFPDLPHVAIFDTAFHQTMPAEAYTYAIPPDVAAKFHIRRYGYHGTSHKFVSERVAEYLQLPLEDVNTIVLHIGNGASVCAVRGGKSVETSMGLTPLEGLMMGTRTGDIDPALAFHLVREGGMSIDEIDNLFNKRSGMLGMAGSNDLRDVWSRADAGDEAASLALKVYAHRIKGYIGNYMAQLGEVDVIAWTAGVGENDDRIRAMSLEGLERLGVRLDPERNAERGEGIRVISAADSPVTVLVVPTNEELEIAIQTLDAIK